MPIRVAFVSQDVELRSMLISVLGSEIMMLPASAAEPSRQAASESLLDAVILDLDLQSLNGNDNDDSQFHEIKGCGVPIIILAGDENRRGALDLVEQGAYGYVRKPPVVRELRAMLRGAYE